MLTSGLEANKYGPVRPEANAINPFLLPLACMPYESHQGCNSCMFAHPKQFEAHALQGTLKECGQGYGRVQAYFATSMHTVLRPMCWGPVSSSPFWPAGLLFFDESIFDVAALDYFGLGVPSLDVQLEFIFFFLYIELVSRLSFYANPFCRCRFTTRPPHISRPMAVLLH